VRLRAEFSGNSVKACIELPSETTGVFVWQGKEMTIRSGKQEVVL